MVRSRSVCSDMAKGKGAERSGKKRSQSVFQQIHIIEDEETDNLDKYVNSDLIVNILEPDV